MKVREVKTSIPGYKPSREERETIIRFTEADYEASVYTYNPALIRKLDDLAETRPEEVHCMDAQSINGVENRDYLVPRNWVKVIASRILSVTEKKTITERILNAQNQKNSPKSPTQQGA